MLDGIAELPYAAVGAAHADPVDPMPSCETSGLLREFPADASPALLEVAASGGRSPLAARRSPLWSFAFSAAP